jgi:hypothetical protein
MNTDNIKIPFYFYDYIKKSEIIGREQHDLFNWTNNSFNR